MQLIQALKRLLGSSICIHDWEERDKQIHGHVKEAELVCKACGKRRSVVYSQKIEYDLFTAYR